MRKWLVLIGCMAALMAAPLMQSGGYAIQVRNGEGHQLLCIPAHVGSSMTLQFTHSMFGGYVRERWRILPDHSLLRTRFVTENAAAAEYYATDGNSVPVSDGFELQLPVLTQRELTVRVNQRGNHVLIVDGRSVALAELIPGSTQIRISYTGCDE